MEEKEEALQNGSHCPLSVRELQGYPEQDCPNICSFRPRGSGCTHPPNLQTSSKTCNLIIPLPAVNKADHKCLAIRNTTCYVLLSFPQEPDVKGFSNEEKAVED